jgi:hypothetical protein
VLPAQGFEVTSMPGDTFVSQQWAGRILVVFLGVLLLTVLNDIRRSKP